MGEPKTPVPALPIIAVIHADSQTLDVARAELARVLGGVRVAGEPVPFRWTEYYQDEMGADLYRSFLVGEALVDRQVLADLKRLTNAIERTLASDDGRRHINLDPGLLSAENFVLASNKGRGHRIYLRDGVFAEVTLQYVGGEFRVQPWTYPDFQSSEVQGILLALRDQYMHRLRTSRPQVVQEVRP